MMFINDQTLAKPTWQAFERMIFRLLLQEGYEGVRLVGRSSDGGADIIARIGGKRWLFQAKNWRRPVGHDVVNETMAALRSYAAQVPVIVALNGFERGVHETRQVYLSEGIPLQLWDRARLIDRASRLKDISLTRTPGSTRSPRDYQEEAVRAIVQSYQQGEARRALVVMATGLGKTFVAAEAVQRISAGSRVKVLVLAHTNELVYQLERAFWPFLKPSQETVVWNGVERPDFSALQSAEVTFACIDSVAAGVERGATMPDFDVIVVDECHHALATMYTSVLDETRAGEPGGPFLLGLTATPWRGDGAELEPRFGAPVVAIDLITGMRRGFLANVDYRVFTSNIDWKRLSSLRGRHFSPKAVNRVLFISEWDDSVTLALKAVWEEQARPRGIVFCGTIDHAMEMRDRINALGFCQAAAIFSGTSRGEAMQPWERNRVLADFDEGKIGVVCAVDIFNEGIDVPDVNILVFQRVTHSRRIFIQQLGRGLRLAPGKERVIVLDFVSDVRRFAADLDLKAQLGINAAPGGAGQMRIRLNNKVRFVRVGGEDEEAESFLRQWLEDVASIEEAEEDASILKYPPALSISLQQRGS